MNIYLLDLFGKWISFLFIGIASLFNLTDLTEEQVQMKLDNNLHVSVINETIDYEVIKKYNKKIPINEVRVVQEGITGIVHKNPDGEVVQVIREVEPEIIEIGTGKIGKYKGTLTGYGPDCKTCDGRGFVYCPTKERKSFNLITDGVYYSDHEYGELRILAAAREEFPCGTIVEVNSPGKDPFIGIVLDSGGTMNFQWENNSYVWIDLAFETEQNLKPIYEITNHNVDYTVKRWGW